MFLRKLHISRARTQLKQQPQPLLNVFDRKTKKIQRERAALMDDGEVYDYLKKRTGSILVDRVSDITRKFDCVVDLGCSKGFVSKHLNNEKVGELILCDNSETLMSQAGCDDCSVKIRKVVCDEESLLDCIEPDSVNLVVSNLVLHWVNDIPGCFDQIFKILKRDGAVMGSLFSNDTLFELRSSFQLAELERKGGISPHISPFPRPSDIGGLLSRSGFVMQTIDTDEIVVHYSSIITLMKDIKGMGENNASWNRDLHLSRDVIFAASALYKELYGTNQEGSIYLPATFQMTNFIAWKPDPSQPQPLERGTAQVSLSEVFQGAEFINDPVNFKKK